MCVFPTSSFLFLSNPYFFLFFFFQAEDGIRDLTVTGVQTCALPISSARWFIADSVLSFASTPSMRASDSATAPDRVRRRRSEERRVGKECRSRWSPCHEKKKRGEIVRACGGRV